MDDKQDTSVHVLQAVGATPLVQKFNLAFDSNTDLVSSLELPNSQSKGTIDSGLLSVY